MMSSRGSPRSANFLARYTANRSCARINASPAAGSLLSRRRSRCRWTRRLLSGRRAATRCLTLSLGRPERDTPVAADAAGLVDQALHEEHAERTRIVRHLVAANGRTLVGKEKARACAAPSFDADF